MDCLKTSNPASGNTSTPVTRLGLATAIASAMLVSACGGGSDATALGNDIALPPLVTAKSCNNISGSLDTLQTALISQLRPAVNAIPTVGAPAASATTALAQTLDTVDALSNALTTLARTQSPQQFTAQLSGAGDAILCSGASLSDALAQLATAQTLPIPGVGQVQRTLALVSERVADGLVGTVPGGDLTLLTSQLTTLANQLRTVAAGLPAQVNQPFLKQILTLNATAFDSLALILADVGALNGTKLSADVTALLAATANSLQVPLATQFGIPAAALSPVTNQITIVSGVLNTGLAAVVSPTLQAVSAVLGGIGPTAAGTAIGSFADLLEGGLSSSAGAASNTRVTQLAQMLTGSTGSLSLVNSLLQSFGGILPR